MAEYVLLTFHYSWYFQLRSNGSKSSEGFYCIILQILNIRSRILSVVCIFIDLMKLRAVIIFLIAFESITILCQ